MLDLQLFARKTGFMADSTLKYIPASRLHLEDLLYSRIRRSGRIIVGKHCVEDQKSIM